MALHLPGEIIKHILPNGLTVVMYPWATIPKVSVQLWYRVGSKNETDGYRGIAHILEHMVFKGTTRFSELDITSLTHKLAGTCNAATSYDYTAYQFDLPSQHWHVGLDILADSMGNCRFDSDMLKSELKAVVQELKLYRDEYDSTLEEQMISAIFSDHPYHYPIIGFKHDIIHMNSQKIVEFYRTYYVPNNAFLILAGDFNPADALVHVENYFGHLLPGPTKFQHTFHHATDILTKSITLYRDVQQATVLLAWEIPGANQKKGYLLDIMTWILGNGRGSRLYKRIVDTHQLAIDLECYVSDFVEHGLLFIRFTPIKNEDIQLCLEHILDELRILSAQGPTADEISRAIKKVQTAFSSLAESYVKRAYVLGYTFLATGDEHYLMNYLKGDHSTLAHDVQHCVTTMLRPTKMHTGSIVPMHEQDKRHWLALQQESDALDEKLMENHVRQSALIQSSYVRDFVPVPPAPFAFPRYNSHLLSNGCTLLHCHRQGISRVQIIVEFKAKYYVDPDDKQGLYNFVTDMMSEGTEQYTADQISEVLESRGISLEISPGYISMSVLPDDLELGLQLLIQLMTKATFVSDAVEKVRAQLQADVVSFWDDPWEFMAQLTKEQLYKNHPYSKNMLGSAESLGRISRDDLITFYRTYLTPQEAKVVIVGDVAPDHIVALLERNFTKWQGLTVPDVQFPLLTAHVSHIEYPINRDQMVLSLFGLSVSRSDPRYDALLLFDQIFAGGVLGSMSSRLFKVREHTGLFYALEGSVVANVGKQPGMVHVATLVSPGDVQRAEYAIRAVIADAGNIEEHELDDAKSALINSLSDHFESNYTTAQTILFMDTYRMPQDYFATRATILQAVKREHVESVVRSIVRNDLLSTLYIGRIKSNKRR